MYQNVDRFLAYLGIAAAQGIYANYGFLKAAAEELKVKSFN